MHISRKALKHSNTFKFQTAKLDHKLQTFTHTCKVRIKKVKLIGNIKTSNMSNTKSKTVGSQIPLSL